MTTRVITPPSMDINRDIGPQNCPDAAAQPSVVALPQAGESGAAGLPEGAGVPPITTHHSLGCPSPAISPNSTMMGPTTELILSTRIRSVPRCLFGPPDPLTAEFARERVKEMRQQDQIRYNFDFDAEKPMEGPYKWEAVPVAPPTTTSNSGSGDAPKAYALSRFPYLSGSMVHIDRGNISPPSIRTTINNNQLPPTRQLYFQPDLQREEREPLLIVRPVVSPSSTYTTTTARPLSSVIRSSSTSVTSFTQSSAAQSSSARVPPVDPTMLLPSPEASSCSSEDSANVVDMDMELEEVEDEEEEVVTSVDSSSTEDDLKISTTNVLHQSSNMQSTTLSSSSSSAAVATILQHHNSSSTSSGLSSRVCSSSNSSASSTTSSRRTKSVSSSSSSPSASPSSPTSSQPPITRYLPVRKRPASTSTTKAASESAPASSAASTENKRAAL